MIGCCLPQHGAFFGGELAQPLREPGVAAAPVGGERLLALLGQRDDDLAAVGLVLAADDVAALVEAVDRAGHRRRLHPLERGELADGALAVAEQRTQDRQLPHREQLVVRVALAAQAARQPRHGDAQRGREPAVGAGDLLDGRHDS